MGQSTTGAGAAPTTQEPVAGGRLTRDAAVAVADQPAEQRQREVTLYTLPGEPTVILRQLTRAEHGALPITEDSDPKDDEAHLVAAAVVDPEMSAEDWKAVLAGWPVGAVMELVGAIGEHNGLAAGAGRRAAQTFRP